MGAHARANVRSRVRRPYECAGTRSDVPFHVPRVGQQVLVDFVGGDIERPLVIGSLYDGQGQAGTSATRTATATCSRKSATWASTTCPNRQELEPKKRQRRPAPLAPADTHYSSVKGNAMVGMAASPSSELAKSIRRSLGFTNMYRRTKATAETTKLIGNAKSHA
jgi:hypothetical protein